MRTVGIASVLALCAGAHGQLWVLENFEAGSNAAGWTFGSPTELMETTGGYYGFGGYLHAPALHTALPVVSTAAGSSTPFTGNYRAAGISRVVGALIVRQSELPVGSRLPAVLLVSFNGTPGDPTDDWAAFSLTDTVLGTAWDLHSFPIPSDQATLPAAWSIIPLGPNAPASPDWNVLIQNVDRLSFAFGDPSASYAAQNWDVGADYILITNRDGCYPNCDGSTVPPVLNVLDFVCFLNAFAAGNPYANCDGSAQPPVLNVLDFGCYLMMFAARGC